MEDYNYVFSLANKAAFVQHAVNADLEPCHLLVPFVASPGSEDVCHARQPR
jgi:hypothetical protein